MSVSTEPSFAFGNPQPAPAVIVGKGNQGIVRHSDIHPDGDRCIVAPIFNLIEYLEAGAQINVVLNWLRN